MSEYTYLDYAAATPVDPQVLEAMQPYLTDRFANPSSLHRAGKQQRATLEEARARIAKILGAKPLEIIFTSGSTEAAQIAIQGVQGAHPSGRIVVSSIEHEAILNLYRSLPAERQGGVVPVGRNGVVDIENLRKQINDETSLVCVQYVNNEVGTIQPIAKIGQLIEQIRKSRADRGVELPLYLYCDAAQAGYQSLAVARLGVDLMSLGSNKLYGPSGVGVLYVRTGVELKPASVGGGQERSLRSGTENVAGAVGMATALELIQEDRQQESKRQSELRDWLWRSIKENIDNVSLNGDPKNRSAGNLNITINGAAGETLVAYLDKEGFAVATGSACTAANQDPSHVLLAMGLTQNEAESSLRITLGRQTTRQQDEAFAKALAKVVPRVRELTATA